MPYVHTKRAKGTTLTQAIYDGDHENHITYGEAQYLRTDSTSVPGLQATLNPGAVGSEVIPATATEYLRQLRYVLKTRQASDQWYQKTIEKVEPLHFFPVVRSSVLGSHGWDSSGTVTYIFNWYGTDTYAGGNAEIRLGIWNSTGSGDVFYNISYAHLSSGSTWVTSHSTQLITRSNTNITTMLVNVSSSIIPSPGTPFCLLIDRDPAHASDTSAGDEILHWANVTYNAYVGR